MKKLFALSLALAAAGIVLANSTDLTRYVNPFVGCAYNGHTFPGATYPFGLVQPSPDSGKCDWQHCSGYVYKDPAIYGFSQTHLSGTGCPDLADVLLQPFTGEVKNDDYRGWSDKGAEKASPGYYAALMTNFGVRVELTASQRVAFHRYTFSKSAPAHVLVDLQHGMVGDVQHHVIQSDSTVEDSRTISGHNEVRGWVRRHFFYVVRFNRPFTAQRILPKKEGEKALRYVLDFDLRSGDQLEAQVALSTVSVDGAKKNLAKEANGKSFDEALANARKAWNDLLSRVEVEGSDDQKANFYTSLYHLFIQPNNQTDVDGQYRGADDKVTTASAGAYYSTLSCWDTFRAAHPLYTILTPELVPGFVNTMLAQQKAVGYVPVWTLAGKDNFCMIGNHSVPVIVDAISTGFPGIDEEAAFQAIDQSLSVSHPGKPKENWDLYDKYGYYPFDIIKGESVSRTLECGMDDWCAAWLAKRLGKTEKAAFYSKRATYYRNLFDRESGFMRGKDTNGKWRTPFSPFSLGHGADTANDFTEGNAWQYLWHVMQDPEGLIELLGGKEKFADKLDKLFKQPETVEGSGFVSDVSGLIGQYAHGNEPSHHTVYFFQFAGRPWRTAELVREVFDKFYLNKVDGLCGNDDCGQMSAWYIFSAMGFYPFNPCASGYVLGAPQLPKMTVRLPQGKTFTVEAQNLSEKNKYVKRVTLNGKALEGFKLSHEQIVQGGTLVFEMSDTANASREMIQSPLRGF